MCQHGNGTWTTTYDKQRIGYNCNASKLTCSFFGWFDTHVLCIFVILKNMKGEYHKMINIVNDFFLLSYNWFQLLKYNSPSYSRNSETNR